jgi:hypothetical protein
LPFPLHVPVAQTPPAQQGWPAPPQTAHVRLSPQTKPAAQVSPLLSAPGQQR